MKYVIKTAVYVTASLLLLTACKKSDDNNSGSSGLSTTAQKVVGSWSIESKQLVHTNANGSQGNVYDNLNECEKDDTYIFAADKTYSVSDGAVTCGTAGYGSGYIWRVPDDSTMDFSHGPSTQGNSRIEQLDNSTLKLGVGVPPNGRMTYVFKRK